MLRAIFTSFLLSFNLGACLLPTQAQVVEDPTLDSRVDQNLVITGGKEAGQNLFHSFSEFSVPSNSTVHFDNSANIENIFSRVTGGSISNIDGIIKANGDASLFLLNPAGIMFGPNAQLDLGGSFIATTAEAIVFSDGIEFRAANTETEALLTVNIPIGLQYGQSPGAIISNGTAPNPSIEEPGLDIKPGNTIALVGGEVLLRETTFNTKAARTEIGSVSDREFVTLQPSSNGWSMNYDSVNEFGKVELSNSNENSSGIFSGNGGSVQIRGREIEIRNYLIDNLTSEDVDGGNIDLIATDLIEIDDSLILTQVGGDLDVGDLDERGETTGNGGNIFLEGKQINLSNGSVISAGTASLGKGGDVIINAKDSIELSGKNELNNSTSFISTSTSGDGAGGEIIINTGNLLLQDGGQIRADSFTISGGAAGIIKVNATESIEIAGSEVVFLRNENLEVIGERLFESGFLVSTESGTGGEINLTASSILLRDDGTISASTSGEGAGGKILINTGDLFLQDGGQIQADSSTIGGGAAGTINVNATGSIEISGTGVFANIQESQQSGFFATTESGTGGEINLTARSILLRSNGIISAEAKNNGDGGNINIDTETLVLFESSQIIADAEEGMGGNIQITTKGLFLASGDEQITASSERGIDGVVDINTPDVDSEIETKVPERSPLAIENLIYTGCSLSKDYISSQFQYIGRGGLPFNPLETIMTEDVMVDLGSTELSTKTSKIDWSSSSLQPKPQEVREATNWIVNQKGNVELVASTPKTVSASACQVNSSR